MALAIESDFRSLKASAAPDPFDRRLATPGRGEDFASKLNAARDDGTETAMVDTLQVLKAGEAGLPTGMPAATPALTRPGPDDEALIGAETGRGTGIVAPLSELEIDRENIREDAVPEQKAPQPEAVIMANVVSEGALPSLNPAQAPAPGTIQSRSEAPAPSSDSKSEAGLATAPQDQSSAQTGGMPAFGITPLPASAKTETSTGRTVSSEFKTRPVAAPKTDLSAIQLPDQLATRLSSAESAPAAMATASFTAVADKSADGASQTGAATGTVSLVSSSPSAPQAAPPSPAPAPAPMVTTHAVITASPAQIVDIVARTAEDGQSDRITVQLDPPELGRVSIDFKFDAQGLQHITITSETPEAMRQLRQMHSELMQALERQGIGSQNMSFQHQQQQQAPQSPAPNPFARAAAFGEMTSAPAPASLITLENPQGMRTLPGGRLDIRL